MKYKCIIVDEEPPAVKILRNYIESLEQLELVGTCVDAFQAIDILTKQKIDLVFLDINMPQLLQSLILKTHHRIPGIIVTTPHRDYANVAFEPNVIDYLSKPVSFECFLISVLRFYDSNKVKTTGANDIPPGYLYFRADRKMVKVLLEDITYVESFKDYIVIHRENESNLKVKYALNSVENMLPHNLFLRIHRSYIVSINKVTAFTNNYVEIGKTELPIGSSYHDVFSKLTRDNPIIQDEDQW